MKKTLFTAAAALACAALPSTPIYAAASQPVAWVSSQSGADSSTCGTVGAPCKTLQYAHDNIVLSGGAIIVRDAGGYGPIVISKAISLISEGDGVAAISVPASGEGIKVAAGTSDNVLVKGFTIDGAGVGAYGIKVQSAGRMTVANSVIRGFTRAGLFIGASQQFYFGVTDTLVTRSNYNIWLQRDTSPLISVVGFLKNVVSSDAEVGLLGIDNVSTSGIGVVVSITDSAVQNNRMGMRLLRTLVSTQGLKAHANVAGVISEASSLQLTRSALYGNSVLDLNIMGGGNASSSGDNLIGTVSGTLSRSAYR